MLQLQNNTPFAATMMVLPDEQAVDTLYITVKASFAIGAGLTLLDKQAPPQGGDVYWGEPGESSLKYASDVHLGKPATDVVMVGDAYAPRGRQVRQLDVALSAGLVTKRVRVFGDRCWHQGHITAPQPFETMPMIYERAFGGIHLVEERIDSAEPRNPVGTGYGGKRQETEMDGVALPNLEDPMQLIRTYGDQPMPACFGFCSPGWMPRAGHAGTYDEVWKSSRAPYLPVDFDKRFFNAAHPGLIYPGYMQGGEMVSISGMHPGGDIQFEVPRVRFSACVEISGVIHQPELKMETLLLEPNALRMSMVWKGAVPCDKQGLKIGEVTLALRR